jgi:hypothetical protein
MSDVSGASVTDRVMAQVAAPSAREVRHRETDFERPVDPPEARA